MKNETRYVTIMVHRDGVAESSSYRIPVWAFRGALIGAATVGSIALLAAILYAPIVRAAARVPFLTREISRLNTENDQVRQLAGRLVQMEARYSQVRTMLGGDLPSSARPSADAPPIAHTLFAGRPETKATTAGPSVPHRWPLDERGIVTRGQVSADRK